MTDEPRYWIWIGGAATGPFTRMQIHEQLAAGTLTGQTQACRIGESTWFPLVDVPGLGPSAQPPNGPSSPAAPMVESPTPVIATSTGGVDPAKANEPIWLAEPAGSGRIPTAKPVADSVVPSSAVPPESPSSAGETFGNLIVIALVGGFGVFCLWYLFFPLSPTNVVEKLQKAKSASDVKPYVTERFLPLVELIVQDNEDPTDLEVITGEYPKPDNREEYFVGVRGNAYLPEFGRRVDYEGLYFLKKQNGWKVDDIYLIRLDGVSFERPISMRELLPGERGRVPRPSLGDDLFREAKTWFESSPRKGVFGGIALVALFKSGVFKAVFAGLVGMGVAVGAYRNRKAKT